MPSYISEKMKCHNAECGAEFSDLLERDKRDEFHECKDCGQMTAMRTFTVPNISTAKLSQTLPDVVAKGRFDRIRTQQELKKAKAHARETGDRTSEKKINKELDKVKK